MSHPVTDADIDDVLASIRRLVMDGTAEPPLRAGPRAAEPSGRLVLTPALRVAQGDAAAYAATVGPGQEALGRAAEPLILTAPILPAAAPDPAAPDPAPGPAASIEAAVLSRPDAWEADGSEGAELHWSLAGAADGPVFRSRFRRDPTLPPAALPEDEAPTMAPPEMLLDEAALRALVAEVVQEELQGALGERITRNVRKLVRREIYRVLASEGGD